MKQIQIRDEYITLGQFLKFSNAVSSGIEAKIRIQEGQVKVNGEIETRRGKKLRLHDTVEIFEEIFEII